MRFRVLGIGLRAYRLSGFRVYKVLGRDPIGFGVRGYMVYGEVAEELLLSSLLQPPGPKKFKLFKLELIYQAKKSKVPAVTI